MVLDAAGGLNTASMSSMDLVVPVRPRKHTTGVQCPEKQQVLQANQPGVIRHTLDTRTQIYMCRRQTFARRRLICLLQSRVAAHALAQSGHSGHSGPVLQPSTCSCNHSDDPSPT
jgi:hypothetical protein